MTHEVVSGSLYRLNKVDCYVVHTKPYAPFSSILIVPLVLHWANNTHLSHILIFQSSVVVLGDWWLIFICYAGFATQVAQPTEELVVWSTSWSVITVYTMILGLISWFFDLFCNPKLHERLQNEMVFATFCNSRVTKKRLLEPITWSHTDTKKRDLHLEHGESSNFSLLHMCG